MVLPINPPDIKRNRRRERPGARARRAVNRRSIHTSDITEGIDLALSKSPLPTTSRFPRRSCEDEMRRAKESEEVLYEYQAMLDRERIEVELEHRRFFGGDEADDDTLLQLGILYDIEESASFASIHSDNGLDWSSEQRPTKRQRQLSLSLHLARSLLSENKDIARWMFATIPPTTILNITPSPTVQHRQIDTMISPLSLPPTPVSPSALVQQVPDIEFPLSHTSTTLGNDSTSTHSLSTPFEDEASWTIITHSPASTPTLEPETWILLPSTAASLTEVA